MPSAATRAPDADTTNASDKASEKGSSRRAEDEELRPYVISGELGKGSFATVYKGYDEQTKGLVAIKTVSRSILTTKLFENLQSEIDILKSLSHRHITKLITIVKAEKNIYLIMEYCSGGDLTNYIKKRGKVETLEYVPLPGAAPTYYPHPKSGGLDEIVVRSFLRQLARALKFLRSRNLIHRDIKPQNLLLKPASPEELSRGHPLGVPILKVADFGFARSLPNAMMAETLCGSPLYMAPEILRYEKYDAKADLWSVGAVLFETAVGRPPFRAQNHIELLKKIEHSKGVKFPDEDPDYVEKFPDIKPVPSDIKKLIRSLLKRFPAERSSFEDFFNSTALARSKFPRPSASTSGSKSDAGDGSSSTSRAPSSARGESEAVVVGTLTTRRQRPSVILESPFPESDRPAPLPPAVDPSEQKNVSPAKFQFRRSDGRVGGLQAPTAPVPNAFADVPRGDSPPFPANMDLDQPEPTKRMSAEAKEKGRPLSTEASIIPGESEEDGLLRREYVMVGDTRAIEFNQTVDEINAGRRRALQDRKLTSPISEKRQSDLYSPDDILNAGPSSANTAFPPPPHPYAPPISSSPSRPSALTRALSIASKKLLGAIPSLPRTPVTPYPERDSSRSPRRQPLLLGRITVDEKVKDPLEEGLLAELEELAQKSDVLTRWADEMYEYVKAIPQKPLPASTKFIKRDGESERQAERRRNADIDAEYNAVTCVALYLLLMSFSQKGIDRLRVYQEGMKMRDPEGRLEVSEGFDDALTWFSEHFLKCSDRAALVKTWLPETTMEGPAWLGQLVYDRALQLSRKAAHMELVDQGVSPLECERLYEESLWCLYALQDNIMQAGNPYQEEDKVTIASWIEKTRKRLTSCQNKRAAQKPDTMKGTNATVEEPRHRPSPPWETNNGSPRR